MPLILESREVRVLGCLLEKHLATPEYYPLSVNALTAACNQKTARDPVVEYSEDDVSQTLDSTREKGLTMKIYGPAVRVPKHRHILDEKLGLARPEMAVLAVLMLRGPQTIGEIRARTDRMHEFSDLSEIEKTLQKLADRPEPLVTRLPRQAGRREDRFAHLLAGEVAQNVLEDVPVIDKSVRAADGLEQRVLKLEQGLEELRQQIQALKDTQS